MVGYSAGSSSSKDSSGSIPKLAIATPESTGIPALPADFWRRSICLANIAGVVIAASSLYNPNTSKGQLVIRALGGLRKPRGSEFTEKKKLKKQRQRMERERLELEQREREKHDQQLQTESAPKTPSPIHTNLQSSPVAADTKALRDAVSAPTAVPLSALRTNKKQSDSQLGKINESNTAATKSLPSSSSSGTLTRISPNGTMETPMHQKNTPNEEDDSPDSAHGLPKISQFLQPKRINMQTQQLQEKSKKRKVEQSKGNESAKSAPISAETTSLGMPNEEEVTTAQAPTFQLNNIGSIPFKSPKPQAKKQRKMGAPSKPKKNANLPSMPFSTPKAGEKPIAKNASIAGERKRDLAAASMTISRTSDDMSTALLLTAMASPKPAVNGKAADGTVATGKSKAAHTITPRTVAQSASRTKAQGDSNRSKSTNSASREDILNEKISEQYHQLRSFLKSITARSMALIHSRNMRGPVPSALASRTAKKDEAHLSAYSKLLAEHRAAHDYLQTRLLRSAETTLRLLLESRITADEARTELKRSIKKFEEILYDTLHRQEMERVAVVAQHHGNSSNKTKRKKSSNDSTGRPSEATEEQVNYPCKEAFDRVEDICVAIGRPVGRPRSALAALR